MTAIYKAGTSARVIEKALHLHYSAVLRNKGKYFIRSQYASCDFFFVLHSRNLFSRGTHGDVYPPLLFLKTFRDVLPLADGRLHALTGATHRKTRLRNVDSTSISAELIAFVERGLLKSNYSLRPYLPNRACPAGDGGLLGVYLAEAVGEPSIAKENNYPSTVCVSCGARSIKINIGFTLPSLLLSAFIRAHDQLAHYILVFVKVKLSEDIIDLFYQTNFFPGYYR